MALVLKQDENGNPVVTEDAKIVYIDDETDSELPLDPVGMYSKISSLGKENQNHRTAKQELESKLASFDGIEDLGDYRKKADEALKKVANFNDEDWMKADKVEKLKGEITEAFEQKLSAKDAAIADLSAQNDQTLAKKDGFINRLMISNRFAVSPHFTAIGDVKAKTTLPPDIGEAQFGKHFRVEEKDDQLILRAYHDNGELILSKVNPGDPAEFEEALSIIIDGYPGKNNILPASPSGSGGKGNQGQGTGDHDELAQLQGQYKAALESGQSQLAINLKNRIFQLTQKLRKSA